MSQSSSSASGGIGIFGAMFIVFLTLKLCGVIDWSWWWVTAPLWAPAGLTVIILLVVLAVIVIVSLLKR